MRGLVICLSLAVAAATPLSAHEFWIEPLDYAVAADGKVAGDLVNGQNFEGALHSYLPQRFTRFELALGETVAPVEGRLGDRPALNMDPLGAGVHVAAFESAINIVRYDDLQQFVDFAASKSLRDAEARHRAAGYPMENIGEAYTRHTKALVAVEDGAGSDRALGLATEMVALANPYTDDVTGGLPVQVLYDQAPRADVQVELFQKAPDGSVTLQKLRTDASGTVVLPVSPGHAYLVNSVVLRPAAPELAELQNVVWETLWASLVFSVPAP